MTDRPIIFSAPMVRALLDGRKVQTRRLAWRQVKWGGKGNGREIATPWQRVQPGDRLWVREAWAHDAPDLETCRRAFEDAMGGIGYGPYYRVGEVAPETLKWRPSIHMPRWASRLTLVVTEVRRQRLQEISADDCLAEGIPPISDTSYWAPPIPKEPNLPAIYKGAFRKLWNDLHGSEAWDANPEVVCLSFSVHRQNIDAMERAAA